MEQLPVNDDGNSPAPTPQTFYEKWDAILRKGPHLPAEEQSTLFSIVRALHNEFRQRAVEDMAGEADIELLNDLADKVDSVYRKFILGENVELKL